MTHDPLCDWRPCTCPLDYDVPERGHMIGCPEDDCECEIIAKVRADERQQVVAGGPYFATVLSTNVDINRLSTNVDTYLTTNVDT